MRDDILKDIMDRRGAVTRIAKACGISTAAVSRWKRVPKGRVATVASITGIAPSSLRPDIYSVDNTAMAGAV